ncbi:MAG: hypothetical protein ABL907_14945 [Hyphomicrobium sp.]
MRTLTSIMLALMTAFSAMAFSANDAEARRYRHHGGAALGLGIAAAVIGGIALSRHHRHHRRHYYSYYDGDYYPSYRRNYYYSGYRPYYGRSYGRSYGYSTYSSFPRIRTYGGHHGRHFGRRHY